MDEKKTNRRGFLIGTAAAACLAAGGVAACFPLEEEKKSQPLAQKKPEPKEPEVSVKEKPAEPAKQPEPKAEPDITADTLPYFKGFNLLNMFVHTAASDFEEKDFQIIRELGFNFVRIPLSYWCWSKEEDWFSIDENALKRVDKCVELGKQYGLHVNLNFHRAPGYCINPWNGKEYRTLFKEEEPQKACAFHWNHFAKRYKGVPNRVVSFNLINEPMHATTEEYEKLVRRLTAAIRSEDPNRLIFIDGDKCGDRALMNIDDLGNTVQSTHGYYPNEISQYQAGWLKKWIKFDDFKPSWPFEYKGKRYDRDALVKHIDKGWKDYVKKGGKIHIGEFGVYFKTPHKVALAYLKDQLSIYRARKWGWALWNFKGTFGVFNSNRKDVKYEDYKGMKLDRKMLELLKLG